MTIFSITILIAGLLYAMSVMFPCFRKNPDAKKRGTYILALAGFIFHTIAMLVQYAPNMQSPVGNAYGLILSIAWIIALLQIAIPMFIKNGFFTMLPVAILTLLPQACPMFLQVMGEEIKSTPSFAVVHGLLVALSYGALAVSALFAGVYLKQKNSLRKKFHSSREIPMPSLEMLEKGISVFIATSATTMFASITAGIITASTLSHTPELLLKFTLGGAIFALQLTLCFTALMGYLRGAKLAKASIALFIFAIIMLIPIELRMAI